MKEIRTSTNAAQKPRNEGAIKAGNGKMTGGHYDPGAAKK